jgi:hypothetical protein
VLAAGLAILVVLAVASGGVGPLKRKPDVSGEDRLPR